MFQGLISGLMSGNSVSKDEFKMGLNDFREKLKKENVIRFYVDGTPNFGHQATTVHLMKRLVDLFEYKNKIEVYYAGEKSTADKLALLITGVNPTISPPEPIQYNGVTITFFLYNDSVPPAQEQQFGFTGGADDTTINYADKLNVKYFLRLQPYNWRLGGGAGNFVPNRIEYKGKSLENSISLSEISKVFGAMPYGYDPEKVLNVPEEVWTWYGTTQEFDPKLASRVNNCKALVDACRQKVVADIWPAYGLHHEFGSGNKNGLGTLLNIVLSGSIYQKYQQRYPIVLTLLNKPDDLDFTYINALYNKGVDGLKEVFNKEIIDVIQQQIVVKQAELKKLEDAQPSKFRSKEKIADEIRKCKEKLEKLNTEIISKQGDVEKLLKNLKFDIDGIDYNKVLKIIDPLNVTPAEISSVISALDSNQIAIIVIGPQPQEIFNYLYNEAGLPCIFEGQGTSSLVISMGKPYFQLNKIGNDSINYPQVPIVEKPDAKLNRYFQNEISNPLRNFWYSSQGIQFETYPSNINLIANCIGLCYSATALQAKYFSSLKKNFQTPFNDKLLLGLVALNTFSVLNQVENNLLITNESPTLDKPVTLDKIYDSLQTNWVDGKVDLFKALPDTKLKSYYSSIVGDSFIISVAKDDIVKSENAVAVQSATTASFQSVAQVLFKIQINFTLEQGVIVSNLTCTAAETWQITDIPWLGFADPGFQMKVYESSFPVQGGAFGTLKAADLKLEFGYPVENNTWVLTGMFESPYPSISKFYQMAGGINLVNSLPAPLNSIAGFGLKKSQLVINTETKKLEYILFEIGTSEPWVIIDNPRLEVQPFVNATINDPANLKDRSVSFTIGGQMVIGSGTINVSAQYPNFQIQTELIEGEIDLAELSEKFGLPVLFESSVTTFNMLVLPSERFYQLDAAIKDVFTLDPMGISFSMIQLQFQVTKNVDALSVNLAGKIVILPDSENLLLDIILSYDKYIDWTFSAALTSGEIPIGKILREYLNWDTALEYSIAGLALSLAMKPKSFEFSGKTAQLWEIDFLDMKVQAAIKIGYKAQDEELSHVPVSLLAQGDASGAYGEITAEIQWHGILINVFYNFNPDYKSFGIQWGNLLGKIEEKDVNGKLCKIATLHFNESTTIGSIVETMIEWATGSKFGLASPWDILNNIPLNNLSLEYNFTEKSVGFNIGIGSINLGFATIKGIKVSYNNNDPDPNNNGVMVTLDIDSSFGDVPSWNAAKPETTPAPPGQGNKYLDIRMLAMGQHVSIPALQKADTVQDAIKLMKELQVPVAGEVPPISLDADSSWLIGMDFGILKLDDKKTTANALLSAATSAGYMLTLQIIFNDPNLYALRIALDGDAAKIFKGLDFQIMYKKISDTVGVYQSEITLPDSMRKIKMGTFNITLPVFAIQIYTNGDFLVDIGFPWNQDFARSLTFQGWIVTPVGPIPVMGSVGIYFGKLSSATNSQVPQTTTGTFNPVLVFGFGIQFGIGFSFSAGILRAGFSLTAIAVLEGILAKWNPYTPRIEPVDNSQLETAYYFWFRGTVGIIGKLYGSVDFAIIKADLNVDIRIIAQITFASYEPILISLTASVDVSLKVSITLGLFKIRISFSFSARISQNVTIQAVGGTAPWHDSASQLNLASRKRMTGLLGAAKESEILNPVWSNLSGATPTVLKGYIANGLTMAGDNTTKLSDQLACYVTMLFIESVPEPQADNADNIRKAFENEDSVEDTSFESLCKMIFRWAVAAIQPVPHNSAEIDDTVVTDEQLELLQQFLNDPSNPVPLSANDIDMFMTGQFVLKISNSPVISDIENNPNATFFPVPDNLNFSVPDYGSYKKLSYDYGKYNCLSQDYIGKLATYFNELAVLVKKEAEFKEHLVITEGDTAMSSFVFCDYFLLLLRQMLQAGRDSLKDFKYFLQPNDTPETIISYLKTNGQSTYSIEKLFSDNAYLELNIENKLVINKSQYLIQSEDTFDSISELSIYNSTDANSFDAAALAILNSKKNILRTGIVITYKELKYTTLPGQSLEDIAHAIGTDISIDGFIRNSDILTLPKLLLPTAQINIPEFYYSMASGDTLRSVATQFNISQADLAANNGTIVNLFAPEVSAIDIVSLGQFKVGELLKEIQATQGLQHLSGMTSKFYMSGLRLPTDGITPLYPGMWVELNNNGEMALPDYAGLYALTGQQFPLPHSIDSGDFIITYTSSTPWLQFSNDGCSQTQITLSPGDEDTTRIQNVLAYARANRLETNMEFLGIDGLFNSDYTTFPFTTQIIWNSPESIVMPYGGSASGVPAFRLWQLPDPLMQLPGSSRAVDPRMKILIGQYNSATGSMDNNPVEYYGYATRAEFSIKKIPVNPDSPSTQMMYEITGADGTNATILEKMVQSIDNNDTKIANIFLAYSTSADSASLQGLQTDDSALLTMGIARVNLSTETKPDNALFGFEGIPTDKGITLLNKKSEFIELLWEAGITRSGGFYLYYYNADNASGLPDDIFNDKNEATLHLIVIYSRQTEDKEGIPLTSYYNTLVTAQAIDVSNSVLFAQSCPDSQVLQTDNTQTLARIAYGYFGNIADIASDNSSLILRNGITVTINEGVYEVGPSGSQPGGDINDIANYFGTTPEEIKNKNPETNWPAPVFTSILLPEVKVKIGTSKGGVTLQSIAAYYNQNLTSFASYNKDVIGIFDSDQDIKISGGPVTRSATVPAGVSAMKAVRTVPPDIPDDPAALDYGKIFLQNTYSMLSYQLVENEFFNASKISLPVAPSSTPSDESNDKIRMPETIAPGGKWVYKQSIPYSRFAKQATEAISGLPDPNESPYRGLGGLLKVDFVWQDYYGNRLITDLSQPLSTDSTPVLNQPPALTGYTDSIIGLNQWPSIASSWIVNPYDDIAASLKVLLSFDSSPYEGLIEINAQNSTTILLTFTIALDPSTATDIGNYSLVQQINSGTVSKTINIIEVVLNTDQKSVTLTIDQIDKDEQLTLTIDGINSSVTPARTFSGVSKFIWSKVPVPYITPVTEAATRNLAVYRQLWYQLNDLNGIQISITTSLCDDDEFILSSEQKNELINVWIASIYAFMSDRSNGGITVVAPAKTNDLEFKINKERLNPEQIFKLSATFTILRMGGAVAGDFETTGGIKQVNTLITAYSGADDGTYTSGYFAQQFEAAMKVNDADRTSVLRIASGVDRTENNNIRGGREIWAVRVGIDTKTGISYEINNPGIPDIFIPRPISNKLESRTRIPIYDFKPLTGIDFNEPSRYMNFSSIDMDVWGKILFTAMDRVLSPEFVSAILIVDNKLSTDYYEEMLVNKSKLADIVKLWMIPIFKDKNVDAAPVQEAFKQQLLGQLSNAYNTNAGIQFTAAVKAATTDGIAPRIYGNITMNFCFIGALTNVDRLTSVDLFFNNVPDPKVAAAISNYSVNGNLTVMSVTLDPDNQRKITLQLNGDVAVGTTTVSIAEYFSDTYGNKLTTPLAHIIQWQVDTGNYSNSISITSPKLDLKPGNDLPIPFLLSSPQIVKDVDGAVISWLDLDLTYSGNAIEHQIIQLSPTNLYFPSSWLNFITSEGNSTFVSQLGKFKVPLLLRAFPDPPSMISQKGAASVNPDEAVDFNKLLNWDYTIEYSMPFYFPQDQLLFTINFNVADDKVDLLAMEDAFSQLAEFITVFPYIEDVFTNKLAKVDATTKDSDLLDACSKALEAFNQLVNKVIVASSSSGLVAKSVPLKPISIGTLPYTFILSEGKATIGNTDALIISIDTKAPEGISAPVVTLEGCTSYLYGNSDLGVYNFYFKDKENKIVSATDGQKITGRSIKFPDINIFARQDAETLVELKRNAELIKGMPSADPFVYTTGQVGFSNNCHPTINYDKCIEISTIGVSPGQNNHLPLALQFKTLFDNLLAQNTRPDLSFLMTCSYSYAINPAIDNINLPVFMQPLQDIMVQPNANSGNKTIEEMITDWVGAIKTWFNNYQPASTNASFRFDLTVFSNLTEQPLPLIRLRDLTLECRFISDLKFKNCIID